MTAEEDEGGQYRADAQCPVPHNTPEQLDVELLGFGFKNTSMRSGIVVAEAVGHDHTSSAIDQRKGVVAARTHDDQRGQRWRLYTGLLVELGRGLVSTCAQPVENGDALGD